MNVYERIEAVMNDDGFAPPQAGERYNSAMERILNYILRLKEKIDSLEGEWPGSQKP